MENFDKETGKKVALDGENNQENPFLPKENPSKPENEFKIPKNLSVSLINAEPIITAKTPKGDLEILNEEKVKNQNLKIKLSEIEKNIKTLTDSFDSTVKNFDIEKLHQESFAEYQKQLAIYSENLVYIDTYLKESENIKKRILNKTQEISDKKYELSTFNRNTQALPSNIWNSNERKSKNSKKYSELTKKIETLTIKINTLREENQGKSKEIYNYQRQSEKLKETLNFNNNAIKDLEKTIVNQENFLEEIKNTIENQKMETDQNFAKKQELNIKKQEIAENEIEVLMIQNQEIEKNIKVINSKQKNPLKSSLLFKKSSLPRSKPKGKILADQDSALQSLLLDEIYNLQDKIEKEEWQIEQYQKSIKSRLEKIESFEPKNEFSIKILVLSFLMGLVAMSFFSTI